MTLRTPSRRPGPARRSYATRRAARVRRVAAGFTLLEVMISLAILAVSLVAILNLHSGGVRMHNHAKHLTVASMLARGKMVEIEEGLYDETDTEAGWPEFDETRSGTFEEEGYPNFAWTAEFVKPDLEVSTDQVTALIEQAMGGAAGEGEGMDDGPSQPEVDTSQVEGMVSQLVQQMVPAIEEGVREVRLTVSWEDITGPSEFTVTTHVVKLPENMQMMPGAAGGAGAGAGAGGGGGGGGDDDKEPR